MAAGGLARRASRRLAAFAAELGVRQQRALAALAAAFCCEIGPALLAKLATAARCRTHRAGDGRETRCWILIDRGHSLLGGALRLPHGRCFMSVGSAAFTQTRSRIETVRAD